MKKLILTVALFSLASSKLIAQTDWNTFNTSYGNIQLGPANADWGHIYTDRPKFIFNKDVYMLTGGLSSYTGTDLSLKTNGTTRLTVKYLNGRVGIGTSTPLEMLHVNGNILIPSGRSLLIGTDISTSGSFSMHNSSNNYNTYADIKGSLYFRRNNSGTNQGTTLGLQSDGTVTIGVWEKYDNTITSTDGHKLMVNGGILCERLKVISDVPNSDYVFEIGYHLRPLSEVKKYVIENKHLPEIPSAQEFKENGYNVGEMDDLLLRKIEELTLYIIQLQEEIEKLKGNNSEK